ncbi:MAG: acyl-CoA dehydratase activase-related protein, partial [Paludibacteraceae bacterium]
IDSKVTRIFYPIVPKEYKEFTQANNSFNCPVVSGYPDVIRSAIDPQANYNIPFDTPVINFANEKALKSQCWDYLKVLLPAPPSKFFSKFSKDQKYLFDKAFEKAIFIRESWNAEFIRDQQNMLQKCINNGDLCFVVAGRPYHADPLVNQKVGQILSDLGVNVMTDDVFRTINEPRHTQKYTYKFTDKNSTNNNSLFDSWKNINFVSQWSYPNRVMQAAIQIAKLPVNIQLVQLNSFGCGPDSFLMDETGEILRKVGKNLTVLRIDEIASPGSIRLRCRSLIESLKTQEKYRETLA